jgi:hypothetical protein
MAERKVVWMENSLVVSLDLQMVDLKVASKASLKVFEVVVWMVV